MEKIEVYSSKKKAIILLIISLIFVVGGIFMFVNAQSIVQNGLRSLAFIQTIGVISVLFFGIGIFVAVRLLIKDQLILRIDADGISVNPNRSSDHYIDWKYIKGFSEITLQGQKIVLINVTNVDYWIERETNAIRKRIMKFNINNYGSPFNLSANTMQIDHAQLIKILNESLNKYQTRDSLNDKITVQD